MTNAAASSLLRSMMACSAISTTFRRINGASLQWMLIYFFTGLVIFMLCAWLMIENQALIKQSILDYLFPATWHPISSKLGEFLLESQARTVIGNALLSGALVMASIVLFPIKEKFSAVYEQSAHHDNGPSAEFSLAMQAVEESKLFGLYLTAQLGILFIGYYPFVWTKALSIGLSFLFLFFTFGLDVISPTLQRHRIKYIIILKALLKRPVSVLIFGCVFSLPGIALSAALFRQEQLSIIDMASVLFLVNILMLTLAIPFGTRFASLVLTEVKQTSAPRAVSRRLAYITLLGLLTSLLLLHGLLIRSLHHKSQILKAHYDPDFSSFHVDLKSWASLLAGQTTLDLSFNLRVSNTGPYDIVLEDSVLIIQKAGIAIADVAIAGFSVPSGQSKVIPVTFAVDFAGNTSLAAFNDWHTVLEQWQMDLYVDIWPGIPFVINLLEAD